MSFVGVPDYLIVETSPIIERLYTLVPNLYMLTKYVSVRTILELALSTNPENDSLEAFWDEIVTNADAIQDDSVVVDYELATMLEEILSAALNVIDNYMATIVPSARFPDVPAQRHIRGFPFRYWDFMFAYWDGPGTCCVLQRKDWMF